MLQTQYITLDEFEEYFQINLREQLGSEEKALGFLKRIEDRMETFLNANFNKSIEFIFPKFTDYQKEHYKLALLEQAIYIFRNGDISVDNGYDPEKGIIIDDGRLEKLGIARNAKQNLVLCNLWNRNLRRGNII